MKGQSVIIETVGTISKKEELVFFENSNNILAFETAQAYPGYNGIVPTDYDPKSIFLITKERYLTEEIFRVSQKIRKGIEFTFNSAVATVQYQNKHFSAIRIKDLKNYSFIPEILNAYEEQGIHFEKKKSVDGINTLIKVTKEFYLEPMEGGCYKDMFDPQMYYFEIPDYLCWEQFEKIIMDIKYNSPTLNFDAAISMFYRAHKVVDAVRIYKKSLSFEELNTIREKFLKGYKGL